MSPRKRTPNDSADNSSDKDSVDNSTGSPEPQSATAVADQPATEGGRNGQSFAERVGERSYKTLPDPFGIATDYQAGVRLMENKRLRIMAIQFGDGSRESKPSQEVIDMVKEAGYRWNPSERMWTHPIRYETAMTTRIEADRLYQDVCNHIREEKGLGEEKTPF